MTLADRASSTFKYIRDSFWAGAYERFVDQNAVEIVPRFSLKDVHGRQWSLDDFLDKPTLLVFTSPHCQPCKSIYPVLRAMSAGSEAESVNLVLLSRGATRTNRVLIEENDLEGVTVLGSRKHVEEQLDVKATPWVVLVGPGGRALYGGVAQETVLTTLVDAANHRVMTAGCAR
jgi:thiol-disulfide isomerase/thioredoxin